MNVSKPLFDLADEVLLRRTGKVRTPPSGSGADRRAVATLVVNLESLGFALSESVVTALLHAAKDDVLALASGLVPAAAQQVGANVQHVAMYPNFPRQVMRAREAELVLNALVHYSGDLVGRRIVPVYQKQRRAPLPQPSVLRPIVAGSGTDILELATSIAGQRSSFSEQDQTDLKTLLAWDQGAVLAALPEVCPNKENAARLVAWTASPDDLGPAAASIVTATDVLRLAVALCQGDVSLATRPVLTSVPRARRRQLLSLLERIDHPVEDMFRHEGAWKRLGKLLHVNEYARSHPRATAAIADVRAGLRPKTFNAKVEEALATSDIEEALALLRQRPGEFARRLDHMLRLVGPDSSKTVDQFARAAPHVSTPVLLQLRAHFGRRDQADQPRLFIPRGAASTPHLANESLHPLPTTVTAAVVVACGDALQSRFAALAPLGKVFVDPDVEGLTVPLALRNASSSLHTMGRGSRVRLPRGDTLRMFLWWKDRPGRRVDLDLSALGLTDQAAPVGEVAYYAMRGLPGCVHSGDFTSAPQGASEFIDLDASALLEAGVRYLAMSVNAYTRDSFSELDGAIAGFMTRVDAQAGEVFEPATVQHRFDLTSQSSIVTPLVFDLVAGQVVWLDVPLKMRGSAPNSVAGNRERMVAQLEAMLDPVAPQLTDLFALHIAARGEECTSRQGADFVIASDGDLSPFDTATILSGFVV